MKQYENVIYSQLEKESEEMYQKRKDAFKRLLLFLSLYVFLFSILDLIYSYLLIEDCQEKTFLSLSLTLNMWFRINGFYGVVYYFTVMIITYYLFTQRTFYRATGFPTYECRYYGHVAGCLTITLFMLLWFLIGFYMFLSYFYTLCTTQTVVVYLWIRLISGSLSSFLLFYLTSNYLYLVL
jgi:hypothetical protein